MSWPPRVLGLWHAIFSFSCRGVPRHVPKEKKNPRNRHFGAAGRKIVRKSPQPAFRADAAFAKPEIYEALEECGVMYAIRIPANESLEWEVAEILFRPPGGPSRKPLVRYRSFAYQAGSWTKQDRRQGRAP